MANTNPHRRNGRPLLRVVRVADDVDDGTVGCAHEEPSHAPPRLRCQRMDDLESSTLRLLVRGLDLIADVDGQHGIDRCGRVATDQLDDGAPVRGS